MAALSNICDLITRRKRCRLSPCTQLCYNFINGLVSLTLINHNQIKASARLNFDHVYSCILNEAQCDIQTS